MWLMRARHNAHAGGAFDFLIHGVDRVRLVAPGSEAHEDFVAKFVFVLGGANDGPGVLREHLTDAFLHKLSSLSRFKCDGVHSGVHDGFKKIIGTEFGPFSILYNEWTV